MSATTHRTPDAPTRHHQPVRTHTRGKPTIGRTYTGYVPTRLKMKLHDESHLPRERLGSRKGWLWLSSISKNERIAWRGRTINSCLYGLSGQKLWKDERFSQSWILNYHKHEVTPSVVAMAVRMAMAVWMMKFQVSFFMVLSVRY